MKKQTTLFLGNNLTADPGSHDFVVDGDHALLALSMFNLTGTAPTIQVQAVALAEDGFDLAYDAQTINFTVGRTLKGTRSNATAVIVADSDGGVSGTLTLKRVQGTFYDNEPLTELGEDVATCGNGLVNGQLVRRVVEQAGAWADTTAIGPGGSAVVAFENPQIAGDDTVSPRRFRLNFTFGGTVTDADFAVDLIQSGLA